MASSAASGPTNTPASPSSTLPSRPSPQEAKLPPSFKITAQQIDDASHARRTSKKRERRLKSQGGEKARKAIEALSEKAAIGRAQSMKEIDKAYEVQRNSREELRAFEFSAARLKDARNLRTAVEDGSGQDGGC